MTTSSGGASTQVQPAKTRALGFSDLREEMDRLWEAVMAPGRPFQLFGRTQPLPAIDVFEKDGALQVRAELPGLTAKDVEITVDADSLTVSGEKKEESEVKEEHYYRSERTYGKFTRRVALPAGADIENVKAGFKDGVLEISIPLKAAPAKKRIEIKPSGA
jgi:HSP20 family protein